MVDAPWLSSGVFTLELFLLLIYLIICKQIFSIFFLIKLIKESNKGMVDAPWLSSGVFTLELFFLLIYIVNLQTNFFYFFPD